VKPSVIPWEYHFIIAIFVKVGKKALKNPSALLCTVNNIAVAFTVRKRDISDKGCCEIRKQGL
jgi:hypothetical protein